MKKGVIFLATDVRLLDIIQRTGSFSCCSRRMLCIVNNNNVYTDMYSTLILLKVISQQFDKIKNAVLVNYLLLVITYNVELLQECTVGL